MRVSDNTPIIPSLTTQNKTNINQNVKKDTILNVTKEKLAEYVKLNFSEGSKKIENHIEVLNHCYNSSIDFDEQAVLLTAMKLAQKTLKEFQESNQSKSPTFERQLPELPKYKRPEEMTKPTLLPLPVLSSPPKPTNTQQSVKTTPSDLQKNRMPLDNIALKERLHGEPPPLPPKPKNLKLTTSSEKLSQSSLQTTNSAPKSKIENLFNEFSDTETAFGENMKTSGMILKELNKYIKNSEIKTSIKAYEKLSELSPIISKMIKDANSDPVKLKDLLGSDEFKDYCQAIKEIAIRYKNVDTILKSFLKDPKNAQINKLTVNFLGGKNLPYILSGSFQRLPKIKTLLGEIQNNLGIKKNENNEEPKVLEEGIGLINNVLENIEEETKSYSKVSNIYTEFLTTEMTFGNVLNTAGEALEQICKKIKNPLLNEMKESYQKLSQVSPKISSQINECGIDFNKLKDVLNSQEFKDYFEEIKNITVRYLDMNRILNDFITNNKKFSNDLNLMIKEKTGVTDINAILSPAIQRLTRIELLLSDLKKNSKDDVINQVDGEIKNIKEKSLNINSTQILYDLSKEFSGNRLKIINNLSEKIIELEEKIKSNEINKKDIEGEGLAIIEKNIDQDKKKINALKNAINLAFSFPEYKKVITDLHQEIITKNEDFLTEYKTAVKIYFDSVKENKFGNKDIITLEEFYQDKILFEALKEMAKKNKSTENLVYIEQHVKMKEFLEKNDLIGFRALFEDKNNVATNENLNLLLTGDQKKLIENIKNELKNTSPDIKNIQKNLEGVRRKFNPIENNLNLQFNDYLSSSNK